MLKYSAFFYFALAFIALLVAVCWLYTIAVGDASSSDTVGKLDTVFSIAIGVVLLRIMDLAIDAWMTQWRVQEISEKLRGNVVLDLGEIDCLCREYDVWTASGPPVSTLVYRLSEKRLDKEWKQIWTEVEKSIGGN